MSTATRWVESELAGQAAVVTGAGSGIGRSLAHRLGAAGMRLVIADIDGESLAQTAEELICAGTAVEQLSVDVSLEADNRRLAAAARRAGDVSIVCLNAGVALLDRDVMTASTHDWEWVLGVNLWGPIHGTRAMLPILLESGRGRISYTASVASLLPPTSPYQVSKWAVHAFATAVAGYLDAERSAVRATTIYVGATASDIANSWRHRPSRWGPPAMIDEGRTIAAAKGATAIGASPNDVAEVALQGILDGRRSVITHPSHLPRVRAGYDALIGELECGRSPS